MEKMLLHVCCGPCSTNAVEELGKEYDVTLFFYNPNIYPETEYKRRLEQAKKVARVHGLGLVEGNYDNNAWDSFVRMYTEEPEGGKRCKLCFEYRLKETAKQAKNKGFAVFATTITTGPNKEARVINEIGIELAKQYGIKFLEADFKKKDGYLKSINKSVGLGLYRQNYCGCVYSLRSSIASPKL
ncbi:MAG: epoxyqueuosine reductase QueH [Candidatus Woesearchaeota archaeon]